jgi:predicted DCC family thiol-disulfide oxidoreductase YuxK
VGAASDGAVLLYDGECGFCSRTVQFILRHERVHTLRFASLGSGYARDVRQRHPGLHGVDSVVWLDAAAGTVLTKSAAILRCEVPRRRLAPG